MNKFGKSVLIVVAVLVAIIILGVAVILSSSNGAPYAVASVSGGTLTGISHVTIVSNYQNISGQAIVASIVLNGKGQNLTSISPQALNNSYPQGQGISISGGLTSFGAKFTYQQSPAAYLYSYLITTSNVQWNQSVQNFFCTSGVNCYSQFTNSGLNRINFQWVNSGNGPASPGASYPQQMIYYYSQACYAKTNSYPFLISQGYDFGNLSNFNNVGYTLLFECGTLTASKYAAIYEPTDTYQTTYNASFIITNQSKSTTINVNDQNPDGWSAQMQTYVIGTGSVNTGLNLNLQNIPTILYLYGQNKYVQANPIAVSALVGPNYNPSLTQALGAGTYTTVSSGNGQQYLYYNQQNILALQGLQTGIQNLTRPEIGTVFANINLNAFNVNCAAGSSCFANPYGTVSLNNQTTAWPTFQIITKFLNLGIGIPVAQPVILGVNISPLASASTQQAVFSLSNLGSTNASVYISGSCNNNAFTSQQNPVSISGKGIASASVFITAPINPNKLQSNFSCSATAYSIGGIYQSPLFRFNITVNPQCAAGYQYINTLGTCQTINAQGNISNVNPATQGQSSSNSSAAGCSLGYTQVGNKCFQNTSCYPGNYLNTNVTPPTCEPIVAVGTNPLIYVIIALIILVIVAIITLIYISKKGGHRIRIRRIR